MDDDTNSTPDDGVVQDPLTTPLPQDDHPLSEPDDIPSNDQGAIDDTHQATDSNIDIAEEYDEGLSGAAEASEPNQPDNVEAYDPDKDERKADNLPTEQV